MLKFLLFLWLLLLAVIGGLVLLFLGFFGISSSATEPAPFPDQPYAEAVPYDMYTMDIVDLAAADGRLGSFAAALKIAGLDETLKGDDFYTVFAPTDEAFDALPAGTWDALLEDPDALADILELHIVEGEVYSFELSSMDELETLGGESIIVSIDDDGYLFVNQAQILESDLYASNGIIHVIDAVMIPDVVGAE